MNAVIFDVKSKVHAGSLAHLNIDGETPVERNIYVQLFGSVPKRDYKVVYYLDSKGKYFVNPPKVASNYCKWPFLTLKPYESDGYENNLAYVCKIPRQWYGRRVSRRVL